MSYTQNITEQNGVCLINIQAVITGTCRPCPWTLCSCSWMCLSSSCCRWMFAWILLVLSSSCSLRCCMAFTCAENSITGSKTNTKGEESHNVPLCTVWSPNNYVIRSFLSSCFRAGALLAEHGLLNYKRRCDGSVHTLWSGQAN